MLIQCAHDLMPCPPEYQVATAEITIETFAALGLTPESLLYAYSFGIAMVLTPALLGYVTSVAIKLIRQL
ncbi:hypothetical protein SAMN02745117_01640 [Lampropedia hyalina DSM 16112]|jgi:hypothetical protein|uniref:Uncharacterized protein n=1 Tax=Lampropedia hyalina DSM 16112 TaxID=1122156 RepID=A0A1M5ACD1_9BURK|nr:hypothetical protein [Lampropedia hyalina]SHF27845.1 hypothetical protein SAMN02745117_01640 [Lampropedia hyalina DSM 16112]